MKKNATPEKIITKQIRDRLNFSKVFHWKQFQSLGQRPHGISDIIGLKRIKVDDLVKAGIEEVGVFLAIEVKAPGKRPSENQQIFLNNISQSKGIAFCADDIETVIKKLGLTK